ncbi:MAG: hypothetical protein Kow0059_04930 [Candidatus Sumerlaeia bacterium]
MREQRRFGSAAVWLPVVWVVSASICLAGGGLDLSPQSPLAPLLAVYKKDLAGQRVILPNVQFVLPRQDREGNAWERYQRAAELISQAYSQSPGLAARPPEDQLRAPGVRLAVVEFYDATRTARFDVSDLAVAAASFLETEDQVYRTLQGVEALARLTLETGAAQQAAGQFDNATDNAQTLLALSQHWLSMPLNTFMIQTGFRYEHEALRALTAIYKATARPDLEQRTSAAAIQIERQQDQWRRKGDVLIKFLPSEHPELLTIIRDDLLADADPAFHLFVLECVNEWLRQTLNRTPEPAFDFRLGYEDRKNMRLLFLAERELIRRLADRFESSGVVGIAFQARQMRELIAKVN